jgi:hypothetical protein
VPWRPDQLLCGVTYCPAEVGLYLWHEFSAERTRRDLQRIRAAGFSAARVPLAWDAFVPTPRQVSRYRLRDLEALLQAAQAASLQVVPVLFAQSWGDCVLLPRYAVARDRRRPGVRVVSDGIIEPGGPRDVWDDPLMLEVESMWLEELLRAFSNHPALLAWDLGHDPATTCRPMRIAHLERWAATMGARVRAAGDPCWLTLGAADLLTARGVRLAAVAPHVDALGMVVHPQRLPVLGGAPLDVARVLFVLRLAQRLMAPQDGAAGDTPALLAVTSLVAEPVAPPAAPPGSAPAMPGRAPMPISVAAAPPAEAIRHQGALLEQLPEAGAVAALAAAWCDLGPRALEAAPYDAHPWLAQAGVAAADGTLKPHGEVWSSVARRDIAAPQHPAPWPAETLDAGQWYENLPDAANDLFARFRAQLGLDAAGDRQF